MLPLPSHGSSSYIGSHWESAPQILVLMQTNTKLNSNIKGRINVIIALPAMFWDILL